MKYNYKNIPIKLNDKLVLINNIDLSIASDIIPDTKIENYATTIFKNNANSLNSTLSFNYYLQENDPILFKILDDTLVKLSFGNIILQSGVLKSLELSAQPNQPISVNAVFSFWSLPQNNLSIIKETNSGFYNFLSSDNITINNNRNYWLNNSIINSINYKYEADIVPDFIITNIVDSNASIGTNPANIKVLSKRATLDIGVGSWWNTDFSISGDRVNARINFFNINSSNGDHLDINGFINEHKTNVSTQNTLNNNISIIQNSFYMAPSFNIVSPMFPNAGDYVFIDINNKSPVRAVRLNNNFLDFNITQSNYIQFQLPNSAFSGILEIKTDGGDITTGLRVHSKSIAINSMSTNFGHSGQNVILYGENFYDISSVTFGSAVCTDYEVVSSKTMYVSVPNNASYNYINVTSDKRVRTAQSPEKFASYPIIDYFTPKYGNYGDTIDIYGRNFNVVEEVRFNGYASPSFSIIDDYHITAEVPMNVNIYGYIHLTGHNSVVTYTNTPFKANVGIIGLSPTMASEGETLTITITNGEFQYLYPYGEDYQYAVYFQENKLGKFTLIDTTTLEGSIPDDFIAGNVYIVEPDGASLYPIPMYLDKSPVRPRIESVNNTRAYVNIPFYTTIIGEDLENVSGIWFDPVNTVNPSPSKIIISYNNMYKNPDGTSIDIVNYTFNNDNLRGTYNLYAVATGNLYAIAPVRYRIGVSGGS
jgi:hypothetical protein